MGGATIAQEVAQVAIGGVLEDDVDGAVLGAAAEQVDDVPVLSHHLHHFHFLYQVRHLPIRCVICDVTKHNINIRSEQDSDV